ncbi:MAG: YaiO family outer membrane beta-barrel protein [Bacteroidaceae bacterium]
MKMKQMYRWLFVLCCAICLTSAKGDEDYHLPAYYVDQAKRCFAKAQWGDGKKVLDEGVQVYPVDPNIRWLLGRYWFERKSYDKSRYQLMKCIEYEYNHVEAKQLLVNVEDITKHYSSAICYVNELLEVNPYWRGLWRRKIELYRKQGNEVEANRLLKRINQIYPNDSVIQKDLAYALEQDYQIQKKAGRPKQAISSLEELIKRSSKKEEYYLDLINLYLQQGYTEKALELAGTGAAEIPSSMQLIYKKVGILSEQYRYTEALAYVKDRMSVSKSPGLARLYSELMMDAARAEKDRDPYVLYGAIYEKSKSSEALDYLLNTSLSRGYDDDARFYLSEAKKQRGSTKELLYKDYMLCRRSGDERRAYSLLQQLYVSNPQDYDIVNALCLIRLKEAEVLMARGDYSEALPHAQFVARVQKNDDEMVLSATEKVLGCYTYMNRYNEALATLDSIHNRLPHFTGYIEKKANLLDKIGRTPDALHLFEVAMKDTSDLMREIYLSGYEEIAVPYIKRLILAGATRRAYDASIALLQLNPRSDLGLHYAINTAALLGKYDEFDTYSAQGMSYYPSDVFYKIKRASVLDRAQTYGESLLLLRPELDSYPDNPELIGAFSQSSEFYALQLLKENRTDSAMALLDTALVYDSKNKSLLYTKGLAYEKAKQYDSAYVYLKNYQPAPLEVASYAKQLQGVKNKSYKNEVGLEYLQSRYAEEDVLRSIATAEYTRKCDKNIYTGRVNYKGLDGKPKDELTDKELANEEIQPGGTGIQLQAEWTHKFSPKLTGMANIAWASKYFPKITMNASVSKTFKNEWEGGLAVGYRRLIGSQNLISVTPSISKTWHPVWTNAKLDIINLSSKFYWNLSAQAKFFLTDDGRTNIATMAGIGSSPEMSLLDNSLMNTFAHTNTMVGLGGTLLLTDHLSVGILGTWHTYYTQKRFVSYDMLPDGTYDDKNPHITIGTQYKNLYNVYLQMYINF